MTPAIEYENITLNIVSIWTDRDKLNTFLEIIIWILIVWLQIIAFDELKTDYKNPIDQCGSLNPLVRRRTFTTEKHFLYFFQVFFLILLIIYMFQVLPEYLLHLFFNILFLFAGSVRNIFRLMGWLLTTGY